MGLTVNDSSMLASIFSEPVSETRLLHVIHILEFSFDFQGVFELDHTINQRDNHLRVVKLESLNKLHCYHSIQLNKKQPA